MRRYLMIAATALALTACDAITGCEDKTRTIDVLLADDDAHLRLEEVTRLRLDGWDCDGVDLYAGGRTFGTRYTCTTCE